MKKIIFVIVILILTFSTNVKAVEEVVDVNSEKYGIKNFINESEKYSEDIDLKKVFNDSIKGKFDNNKILKLIFSLFSKNLKSAFISISEVIIIVIISSILKAISENLGNNSVSKVAFYIQYILIVVILSKNFSNILIEVKDSIHNLTSFTNSLVPLLTTLLIASGNIITSNIIEPILLVLLTFISNFVTNILIPFIICGLALEIVSKISENIQIDKLANFFKKSSVWVLVTVLGLFISLASLESGLTNNIDTVTKNFGKSIVSTSVPVVGSILGNAIDTISGYGNIIKNSTGFVGIIIILSICLKPIINLACLTIVYYLGMCLVQPVADKKIVTLIGSFASTFKILLAIMFSITVLIIIGISIVIKVTS